MSNSLKQVRGQLRQIAKEILPQVLSQEIAVSIHAAVVAHVDARIDAIEKHLKSVLASIEQRTKDTQSYLIRHVTSPQVSAPKEVDSTLLVSDENS